MRMAMLRLCPVLVSRSIAALAQDAKPNLLANPGFEELEPDAKASDWKFTGKGDTVVDEARAHRSPTTANNKGYP